MVKPGQVLDSPVLGARMIVHKTSRETEGRSFEVEWFLKPGYPAGFPGEHLHPKGRDIFEILSGTARYQLNRQEYSAKTGDMIEVPPLARHIHPWNVGADELHFRHVFELPEPNPDGIMAAENLFETAFGLARDGKVDKRGFPNILQLAVGQTAREPIAYVPGPSLGMQDATLAVLAWVGRRLGYRATYPKYEGISTYDK